jgi:SAM-dependent methyltransferase
MGAIKSMVPEWARQRLRRLERLARTVPYYGTGRVCPVCGKSSRRFREFGVGPREDAQCVQCGALERHRFLWLYVSRKTDLLDGRRKKMLHIAPESCFESKFKGLLGQDYLTADLRDPRAMMTMDITDIQYEDQSFDVIYCSHVLEHVQNDKKALRELFRVLKNDGWAILLVPITSETTVEDPSIVDPIERLRAFGQEDHVRKYGRDYVDRLREAGFTVEITKVDDLVCADEVVRMGLTPASGEVYHCTK